MGHVCRYATPMHRLLQVRMTTAHAESSGQRREPDRKVL
jgi:hypothetical protein